MRLSILSVLSLVGAGMVSALPQESSLSVKRGDTSDCVGPLLCCGTLTTPLDPLVDPILLALGINAAKIVGSIGLLCMFGLLCNIYMGIFLTFLTGHEYEESSCDTAPQCCSEVNLL
jgi:Fungal hydrophobin.